MAQDYERLGNARVFRDRRTGELIVDTKSIRGEVSGADDELGGDEDGFGGPVDEGFGHEPDIGRRDGKGGGRGRGRWGMTAVSGSADYEAAGPATVRIRLQHDFKAEDITFTGSVAGATVTSIFFGDQAVWSTPEGIDVSVFGSNSMLRGLLKGQEINKGLDITINGTVPGEGRYAATLMGQKPTRRG